MSYPKPIVRVSWGGTVASGDVWTNSVALSTLGPTDNAGSLYNNLNMATLKSLVDTAFRTGATSMSSFNDLRWYKVTLLDVNGATVGEPRILDNTSPLVGSNTGAFSPQETIVITLDTGAVRGLAKTGRIFPPAGFASPGANGRLSSASITTVLDRFETFFEGLNTLAESTVSGAAVSVVSGVREGEIRHVSSIRVGDLVDTQRRRRNRLTENYTERSLA